MVDIMVGNIKLRSEAGIFIVEEEALTKENDIVYKNQTYHSRIEPAIYEMLMHRKLCQADSRSLKELHVEVLKIRKLIDEVFHVPGN